MAKAGRKPKPPEKKLKPRGIGIAMTDGLYALLVEAAEASGRTINAEARYQLSRALEPEVRQ